MIKFSSLFVAPVLVVFVAISGCDVNGETDPSTTPVPEAGADSAADAGSDAPAEATVDATPDTAPDTGNDADAAPEADAGSDASDAPDADDAQDAAPEATPDAAPIARKVDLTVTFVGIPAGSITDRRTCDGAPTELGNHDQDGTQFLSWANVTPNPVHLPGVSTWTNLSTNHNDVTGGSSAPYVATVQTWDNESFRLNCSDQHTGAALTWAVRCTTMTIGNKVVVQPGSEFNSGLTVACKNGTNAGKPLAFTLTPNDDGSSCNASVDVVCPDGP